MRFNKKGLLSAAAGIAMAAGFAGNASASSITLDPSQLGYGGAPFSTEAAQINSDSLVVLNAGGTSFTETGVFVVGTFAGQSPSQSGLGVNYGMYGTFAATGTGSVSGGVFTGGVSTFTLTLYSTTNAAVQIQMTGFNAPTLTGTLVTDKLLGAGSLVSNQGASISTNKANINATTNFTVDPAAAAFFVAPNPFLVNFLESITTNVSLIPSVTVVDPATAAECTAATAPGDTCFALVNVAGPINFDVPEPGTLAMFGVGLLGLGVLSSRRRKAA
jgi:hypothetical protein